MIKVNLVYKKNRMHVYAVCLCGFENKRKLLRCPKKDCRKSLRARGLKGKSASKRL